MKYIIHKEPRAFSKQLQVEILDSKDIVYYVYRVQCLETGKIEKTKFLSQKKAKEFINLKGKN